MKLSRKILAVVTSVVMVLAMVPMAWATDSTTGSITISGAAKGETYSAYEVFSVESVSGTSYSYKVTDNFKDFFWDSTNSKVTTAATTYGIIVDKDGYVTQSGLSTLTDANKAQLAKDLLAFATATGDYSSRTAISATGTAKAAVAEGATTASATISNLPYGYYVVDTSLGALCALDTISGTTAVTINEKNSAPTVTKTVKNTTTATDTTAYASSTTASINNSLSYQVVVNTGSNSSAYSTDITGVDANYVITETPATGITADWTKVVVTTGTGDSTVTWTKGTDYTVSEDGVITLLSSGKLASQKQNTDITITYPASVGTSIYTNGPAATAGAYANGNKSTLTYQSQSSESTADVLSYRFSVVKTKADNKYLSGAKFKLYTASTDGTEIPVVYDSTNKIYRVASSTETGVEIEAGIATIAGLGNGTYYLEETTAPTGYNKLTARVAVTINSANNTTTFTSTDTYASTMGGVQVVNNTGAELPSTGGIGTTIFYVVGAVIVLGAVVALIVRRRMKAQKE